MTRRSIQVAAISTLIAAMFFWFTWPGLGYYFTDDDVMNLRRAWPEPVWSLVRQCITMSPDAYRPFGLIVYRAVFSLAGFHPLPFHLVSLGFLSFNVVLLGWLARRLTGSIQVGLLAALIGCFHSRMDYLYLNTGTIYDIVCFTLYVGGLVWYIRIRQSGKLPSVAQTAVLLLMCFAALNSKETAATWSVMLLAYEVLYHGVSYLRRSWVIWLSTLMTVVFLSRKLSSASALVQVYKPQYSWGTLVHTWQGYLGALFYRDDQVAAGIVFLVWFALLVVAVALRSKALQFACLFIFLTPLPVGFVLPRGMYVWYIPLVGWALYTAVLLALASRWVRGISPQTVQALVFATCALLLAYMHGRDWPNRFRWDEGKNVQIREFAQQIVAQRPAIPKGTKILLLGDPFGSNEYTPSSLIQLCYGDATLEINRTQQPDDRVSIPTTQHDIVFAYRNGRMIEVPPDTPIPTAPL